MPALTSAPAMRSCFGTQNHPTNLVAWKVRAARHGFALKIITFPANPGDEEELLALWKQP